MSLPEIKLADLFKKLSLEKGLLLSAPPESDQTITSVTSNSKEVRAGTIFVAIAGEKADGHDFIDEAIKAGANWVFTQKQNKAKNATMVTDTRKVLGLLASALAHEPSKSMKIIGVTGTSGKTTTTFLLESIFKKAGHVVGLIGTNEIKIAGKSIPSTHTTPGPVELQTLLQQMKSQGCTLVVMEVSSHALKQHRAIGVAFDGVIFNNLTPEHLDYHPDIEDYYQSKKILFTTQMERTFLMGKKPVACIHDDHSFGTRLLKELNASTQMARMQVRSFSVDPKASINAQGIRGTFSTIEIHSSLMARFNAENIAAAVSMAKYLGVKESDIQFGIQEVKTVAGRLERVRDPRGKVVLVDYAHKPDALEKVLITLNEMKDKNSKLITVFGCGGDRDRNKRPLMGEIAVKFSSQVIVTSDNPRTENPEHIIREIVAPLKKGTYQVISDRKTAIETAIGLARPGDLVLIAGKGHETYQIIGTEKLPFDDRQVAANALGYEI